MSRFDDWLAGGVMIADGAWGTQLQARGLPVGVNPDSWNLTHHEFVHEVARAYVDAGSQVILTNTFRATSIAMPGVPKDNLVEINRAGVRISKSAAAGRALVFASIGPTGKVLMSGEVSAQQVSKSFSEQARALASMEPDAILVETMSDTEEARIAVEAAKYTGLPVIASFTFDSGKNKDRTRMGATPEMVAAAMIAAGADAVGANCGVGVESSVGICARLHAACHLPVWIKPNAGLPKVESGETSYDTSAEEFASHFAALRDAGASFIGACCGSTPDFIRALVAARRSAA
jgi:5-methyltetrahydrofolate--homocysteine methyltransferase